MKKYSFLILTACILLVFTGCKNRNNTIAEIKALIEKNCDCQRIETEVSEKDSLTMITFNLYDCKFEDDYKEADKIIDLMRKNESFCNMEEKINFQFVVNTSSGTKYYPHVYWKCTPQFEF